MGLDDDERAEFARLVRTARRARFHSKAGAYRAAKMNATTWDRIEKGLRVRDDRMVAAAATLWPESDGDWRSVLNGAEEPSNLEHDSAAALSDEELLAELERRLMRLDTSRLGEAQLAPDDFGLAARAPGTKSQGQRIREAFDEIGEESQDGPDWD